MKTEICRLRHRNVLEKSYHEKVHVIEVMNYRIHAFDFHFECDNPKQVAKSYNNQHASIFMTCYNFPLFGCVECFNDKEVNDRSWENTKHKLSSSRAKKFHFL